MESCGRSTVDSQSDVRCRSTVENSNVSQDRSTEAMCKPVRVAIALLTLGVASCHQAEAPVQASMIALLANPQQYAGKRVQVAGFMHLEFEGDAIYLHQDDAAHSLYKNGLWVSFEDAVMPDAKRCNDHYVVLTGTFDAKDQGHMGLWSGSIVHVSRLYARPAC